jgi:hypothetical protein
MKTRITELVGIERPIIQGGMHYVGLEPPAPLTRRTTARRGMRTKIAFPRTLWPRNPSSDVGVALRPGDRRR